MIYPDRLGTDITKIGNEKERTERFSHPVPAAWLRAGCDCLADRSLAHNLHSHKYMYVGTVSGWCMALVAVTGDETLGLTQQSLKS